ncbi:TPA: AAA family ATPase [Candidatus Woesearchaeota archaeon]|nr:AAA family ATPase [Candidatus Woesearchaeota archaeon]
MIITFSGTPGSGKSTVAKILVDTLRADRIYVGGVLRELARKKGMTLQELLEFAKKHAEIDREADEVAATLARDLEKQEKVVIVEGRVQFHFLPESVKVFLKVSLDEAARRIWNDLQHSLTKQERNEEEVMSVEELKKKVELREEEDAQRYRHLYNVDYRNTSHYDLVVDTTHLTPLQAAEMILRFVRERQNISPH